jgi:hypothetical protein
MIAHNDPQPSVTPGHPLFNVDVALAQGARQQAVRLFLEKAEHLVVPPGTDLLGWVLQCLGRTATGRLVEALASHPCFYCNGGYTKCEDCAGHGATDGEGVCLSCLGTGLYPCDFCNASGLVTVTMLHKDFQLATVMVRVRTATAEAEQLLRQSVPQDSPNTWRAGARLLLKLNRLVGAAENGAVAAVESIPRRPANERQLAEIVRTCGHLAGRIDRRVQQILAALSVTDSARGTFYRDLAKGEADRSWLDHPAVRRLQDAADHPIDKR